uniref:GOLD domain-containing protein n=1 Tax=Peronospora matthiolae TaxID=2874970 RepID=A0AAV1TRQ7_9STRA
MSRSWSSGWALGLLLLSVLDGACALYFTVLKQEDRCFVVDVPAQTTVRAEYESPDTTDVMKTVLTVYSLDLDDDALVDEATGVKGSKSFTAQHSGIYWVCVSLDSSNYALPDDASMRFTLKLVMGTSQEEYRNLAKKNQMDDLHLKILQLRDRVTAIQRNQDYAKEKSLAMQSSIESNNQRAMWVSLLQIATLLITGFYQAKHLKAYLYKKKLV